MFQRNVCWFRKIVKFPSDLTLLLPGRLKCTYYVLLRIDLLCIYRSIDHVMRQRRPKHDVKLNSRLLQRKVSLDPKTLILIKGDL